MVDWLLKELAGNPQAPIFPLQDNLLSGPDILCNPNTIYSFPDICKVPSPVKYIDQNGNPINGWSVSPNLQIDSSTPYSIFVSPISNGEGFITATFQNGQKVTKTIWVGKPSFTLAYNYFDAQPIKSTVCVASDIPNLSLAQQGVTNISFRLCNSTTPTTNGMIYCTMPRGSCCIEATVTNVCGSTTMLYDCSFNRQSSNTNYYKIYPNPSSDIVNVELRDMNNLPDTETIISGELFDMMGQTQTRVAIVDHKATFSVQGLNKGIYILKIYINNQVESHQVAVE